jgi:hypothetical protein
MTDVEQFWLKLQPHFPNWKPWHTLDPMQQMQVVQGINMILIVTQ